MSKQPLKREWASLRLLVDGYNLAFESGTMQHGSRQPNALRNARDKLLSMIRDSVPPATISRTLVVFDSEVAPKGTVDEMVQYGISVKFSSDWNSADELIQQIIGSHHSPKILTVVSSDHAIQRRAQARGASAFDCLDWIEQIEKSKRNRTDGTVAESDRAEEIDRSLSSEEHKAWLREFGFEDDKN